MVEGQDVYIIISHHLAPMPEIYMPKPGKEKPKGVQNRMKGLEWIMNHVADSGDDSGVFYFADDDNTYDLRLFEEVHSVSRTLTKRAR
jgi:hypothetical protein